MSKNRSKLSVVLIVIGLILGYPGIFLTGYLYIKTGNTDWIWIGSVLYAVSWIPYGLGLVMLGGRAYGNLQKKWTNMFKIKQK
ncbi:MAG: hypothetical protein ISS10_02425 [Candidatus Marinimicrobia bacterium]|nr:hypothetical protein [Candidatus Neomarinimicrobiota bacterium]MBL7059835.1 hypothetical protein [Candidatus Neomarinimicrobiota bacterium]